MAVANFLPLAFIDVFELSASLVKRMGVFESGAAVNVRALAKEWPELRSMLAAVKRLGDQRMPGAEVSRLELSLLRPFVADEWYVPRSDGSQSVHLPLRTNPGCMMYAGVESAHLPIGHLTLVNQGVWTSAVNFGETPRVHLVVDFRAKVPDQA